MDFAALGGLAHGFARELVGLQVEGPRFLLRDPGPNDAHYVRHRSSHLFKHCGGIFFYFGINSGTDEGIRGHTNVVAQLGYERIEIPGQCFTADG